MSENMIVKSSHRALFILAVILPLLPGAVSGGCNTETVSPGPQEESAPPPEGVLFDTVKNSELSRKELKLVVEAPEPEKSIIEDSFEAPSPVSGYFSIRIIKPDPNIDYKILSIKPDPNIDYKIQVIDPETGVELEGLSKALRDKIKPFLPKAPKPDERMDKK